MSYVYKRTEPSLWTVGYYEPNGRWEPESDHGTSDEAAKRVAWLNGDPRSGMVKFMGRSNDLSVGSAERVRTARAGCSGETEATGPSVVLCPSSQSSGGTVE